MSYEYFARPVTLSGPSRRLIEVPMRTGFAGHKYLAGAFGGAGVGAGTGA